VAAVALALAVTGCTGGGSSDGPRGDALPDRSVGAQPRLTAKPVPTEVTVGKVIGGKLSRTQRRRLETQVARLVSRYFDAAYLGGEYPRRDFSGALAGFSSGAARGAGKDRTLLTNAGIGTTTRVVVPRTKQVRLDVLVPRHRVVGLTARVRLVFVRQPTDGADERVTVAGRLLVNRKASGSWQIFGYDLKRTAVPASKGANR
jgi:hypothetical protein